MRNTRSEVTVTQSTPTLPHYNRLRDYTGLDAMGGLEFTAGPATVFGPLLSLPPAVALSAFAALLLIGMAGCTAAMIDGPAYPPSPNICRVHEVNRTDCVRPTEITPIAPQDPGVGR